MKPRLLILALLLTGCSLRLVHDPRAVDLRIIDELADHGQVLVHPEHWRCDYDGKGCKLCWNWSFSRQEILIRIDPHAEPEVWSVPIGARIALCRSEKRYAEVF